MSNEWISVKDRLPNEDGKYLCYVEFTFGSYIDCCYFSHNLEEVNEFIFNGKQRCGWYINDDDWGAVEKQNITHWMPLPEPPKGE